MRVTKDERAALAAAKAEVEARMKQGTAQPEVTVLRSSGGGRVYLKGTTLWLDYGIHGKRFKESTRTQNLGVAKAKLAKRMGAKETGTFVGPAQEKLMFSDLEDMIKTDYKMNARRSARRIKSGLRHLHAYFGTFAAVAITTDRVREYIVHRQEQRAAAATISKELGFLKRAFNLAVQNGRLSSRPYIPSIQVSNVREGFFEAADLEKVLKRLPEPLRAPVRFAFWTGWRRGEVLSLQWSAVDWTAGVVRLAPGRTKNKEGREFPFRALPQLEALLKAQREATRALEKKSRRIIPDVFHRKGKPIRDMGKSWRSACKAAGMEGWYFHDLRRSAVRNMERAGVSRSVAMKLSGHRTEAIYRRYAIADAAALAEGVGKLARLHAEPAMVRVLGGRRG